MEPLAAAMSTTLRGSGARLAFPAAGGDEGLPAQRPDGPGRGTPALPSLRRRYTDLQDLLAGRDAIDGPGREPGPPANLLTELDELVDAIDTLTAVVLAGDRPGRQLDGSG